MLQQGSRCGSELLDCLRWCHNLSLVDRAVGVLVSPIFATNGEPVQLFALSLFAHFLAGASLPDNISTMSNCDQTPRGLLGTLLNETLRLFFNGGGMAVRPLLETVLKVVVMAATMCSGIVVAKYDVRIGEDKSHEGGRGSKQDQRDLDRAA